MIITAKREEFQAIEEQIPSPSEWTSNSGHILSTGTFEGNEGMWDVYIAEIGMYNTVAGIHTSALIRDIESEGGLDLMMFVGIAGGIKDVKEGDVVASSDVMYFESGKVSETVELRPISQKVNIPLEQRARAVARRGDWRKRRKSPHGDIDTVEAFVGRIVSGESVMANTESEEFRRIKTYFGDALALDMEGFGFLGAAFVNGNLDAIVVRGISDMIRNKDDKGSEGEKGNEKERQKDAARNASAFAFEFLSTLTR